MRLVLIALCLALANASYFGKNRFRNLLNRHQNTGRYGQQDGWGQEDLWGEQNEQQHGDLYGSDDVDDYVDEYVQEIRRQRGLDRRQCPRDTDHILGQWGQDDETDYEDDDEEQYGQYGQQYGQHERGTGRRGQLNDEYQGRWTQDEDESRNRYTQQGNQDWNQEDQYQGRWNQEDQYQGRWTGDEESESGSPLLNEVHDANTKLASRLYKESKEEKDDKNIVVSPLSIQLALAALNAGTRGTTRRQIGRVIAGNLKKEERRQVFKTLVRRLKGFRQNTEEYSTTGRKCQIKPVTGIFITQITTKGQQQFMQVIKRNLGATVKHCNFHRQPQQCRQMINRWMGQRTQEKINRIIPQDAITDNTKMILVNSMHVNAQWGPQMRRHVTKEAKFYPLDTKKVKVVEVMETQGRFKYHEDELVKIVGVPTQQKEMTLYVIVPKDKDGLTEVEKLHLQDGVQLKQLLKTVDHRQPRHVGLQLPKFQIKHKIDVRRTLRKQGVTDAFDPLRADFSGITGVPKTQQDEMEDTYRTPMGEEGVGGWSTGGNQETKLHLNKFIHQSTIKITESGITATTGSGSNFEEREQYGRHRQSGRYGQNNEDELNVFDEISGFNSRESTQKMVKANRAFAFVLKHNPTNQLIFVGRVIDAAQKKITQIPENINVVDQF